MVSLKAKYKYDMADDELETYVSKEEDQVIKKLKEALRPCEGVDPVLEKLAKDGKYKLSVVSSSALRRVNASIVKVGQDKYFADGMFPLPNSNLNSHSIFIPHIVLQYPLYKM